MNLYIAAIKALAAWSGGNPWVLVLPSLVAAVATVPLTAAVVTVPLTAALALRLADPPTALVAAGLVAVNPYLVAHSVQIRAYVPLVAFTLASFGGGARLARDSEVAARDCVRCLRGGRDADASERAVHPTRARGGGRRGRHASGGAVPDRALPPLLVLVAYGIVATTPSRTPAIAATCTALVCLSWVPGLLAGKAFQRDYPWNEVAAGLREQLAPGDVLLQLDLGERYPGLGVSVGPGRPGRRSGVSPTFSPQRERCSRGGSSWSTPRSRSPRPCRIGNARLRVARLVTPSIVEIARRSQGSTALSNDGSLTDSLSRGARS